MTFTYTPRPLASLSPDRVALYTWAEAHDWQRLVISDYETICGGSAERWQQAVEQLSKEQVARVTAAITAYEACWQKGA